MEDFIKRKSIENDLYVTNISVFDGDKRLNGVYSDYKSASLKYFVIEDDLITTSFIDKIYASPKNPLETKNIFQYLPINGREYIFYKDYEKNDKVIFKLITKTEEESSWTVYPQNVIPDNYLVFYYKNELYTIYYEDVLKFGVLKNYQIIDISTINIDANRVTNLKISNNGDAFYLFYTTNHEELNCFKFKIERIDDNITLKNGNSEPIDIDVKYFDATVDNLGKIVALYYKSKDYSLNLYKENNNKKEKFGFFADIQALELLLYNDLAIVSYSSINLRKSNLGDEKFYLSVIYNKNFYKSDKWSEHIIENSENPILSTFTYIKDRYVNVYSGGDSLKNSKIKVDFFKK